MEVCNDIIIGDKVIKHLALHTTLSCGLNLLITLVLLLKLSSTTLILHVQRWLESNHYNEPMNTVWKTNYIYC